MPKSWIGWLVLIIILAWVFHNPAHAGTTVSNAFHSAVTFFNSATGNL
jgi:hypothetical protein